MIFYFTWVRKKYVLIKNIATKMVIYVDKIQ